MRRVVGASGAALLLAISTVSLAHAQEPEDDDYGPTEGGVPLEIVLDPGVVGGIDGSGQPATGGAGQPGDTGTGGTGGPTGGPTAPPASAIPATTNVGSIPPGGTVVVTPPSTGGAPAFQAGSTPSVGVNAGSGGGAAQFEATVNTDASGTVTISVTMPTDTPEGIYYVYITGVNAAGETVTFVADITVSPAVTAAAQPAAVPAAVKSVPARRHEGPAPASVQALYVTPEREAELVEAVVEDGAEITIDGTELLLHRSVDDLDEGRPLVAALVVAAVGGSLALLRRRPAARRVLAR